MCVIFFFCVLLEFDLASLEVMVAETSVNPHFFLPAVFYEFFTSFFAAFPFCAILFLLFPNFGFFSILLTGLVPRKTTTKATETALETAEVTGIPVPEEAPRNGCGS